MRLLCPAKINLHLRVGPRRDDGFHSLLSWFCTAGLFDTLTLESTGTLPGPGDGHVSLACDQKDLPTDRQNLVVKAGDALADDIEQSTCGRVPIVAAFLQKRIPAGAGLGGGSSDGARALLGLNALWRAGRPADFLSGFAGRFGSDLPFFFHGPSSICTGRGEYVRPVHRPRPRWVLLILPDIAMPTAQVYRQFDAMKLGKDEDLVNEPDWNEWSHLDAQSLTKLLINDLEAPAFAICPALASLRGNIEKLLDRTVRMSGSGSSLFTLYDAEDETRDAKTRLAMLSEARVEIVELAPEFIDDLTTQIGDANK